MIHTISGFSGSDCLADCRNIVILFFVESGTWLAKVGHTWPYLRRRTRIFMVQSDLRCVSGGVTFWVQGDFQEACGEGMGLVKVWDGWVVVGFQDIRKCYYWKGNSSIVTLHLMSNCIELLLLRHWWCLNFEIRFAVDGRHTLPEECWTDWFTRSLGTE